MRVNFFYEIFSDNLNPRMLLVGLNS